MDASRRLILRSGLTGCLLLSTVGPGRASLLERWLAPSKNLWPRWQVHDPAATARIDHGAWDRFLARYLLVVPDGANRLRYAAVTAADRSRLQGYLDALAATRISRYARPEQFAFWVNLYNALTVAVVLDTYPVDSIRDISSGLFSVGPWDDERLAVEGVALSLNDIEHRILRPIWDDPRIHYAVNCASIGCPDLQAQAFTAENAESRLEQGARTYINSPRGVRFEHDALHVSSLYNWFREDFGGSEAGVIRHLRRYADPALAQRLEKTATIAGYGYDWALNDVARITNVAPE